MSNLNTDLRRGGPDQEKSLAEVILPDFNPDSIAAKVMAGSVFALLAGVVTFYCGKTFFVEELRWIGAVLVGSGLLAFLVTASVGGKSIVRRPSIQLFECRVEFDDHSLLLDEIARYEPSDTTFTGGYGSVKFLRLLQLKLWMHDGSKFTWSKPIATEDSPERAQFEQFVELLSERIQERDESSPPAWSDRVGSRNEPSMT